MYDVLTIGSALVDIFIHSDQFQLSESDQGTLLCQHFGDKVAVDSFVLHTGGGASNTAVGFKRMGFQTAIIAELGKDQFATVVEKELRQADVVTDWLIHEKKEQTGGSVILIAEHGGRTALVYRGASAALGVSDVPVAALTQTQWVHMSSIAGQVEVLRHVFQQAREHQFGLSWNPGKAELKLLAGHSLGVEEVCCQIMVLNQEEWDLIPELQSALRQHISQIIVTDGSRGGTIYLAPDQSLQFSAHSTTSVDDTGAGDAFTVGYIAAHLLDYSPAVCAKWGAGNAASTIENVGAKPGLLTRPEVERMM